MKKRILGITVLFMLLFTLFALAGCFGSSDPPPEVKLEDLLGTWIYSSDSGTVTVSFHENMRYTLRDTLSGFGTNSMGDFSLDGNKITMTPSEGTEKKVHEITAFDGDTMVWGSGSFAREYKKQ